MKLPPDDIGSLGPMSEKEWEKHRRETTAVLPSQLAGMALPDILLPFQKELLQSTAQHEVTVAEKSRRTGATWAVAADAVLASGAKKSDGGMDTFYIGYNLDMAREFIATCAMWARAFAPLASEVQDYLFRERDEKGIERDIQAFRIRFASGFEIVALASRPRSLRGMQGYVILDEFAFHDDPDELLKAAFALLIWGGKVLVISTHNGTDNRFNTLIQDVRSGKTPGNVVRCTFDEALEDGLYQRICLVTGKEWTPEKEAEWRAKIRKIYGAHAAEELDCVPSMGTGVYLTRALIEACCNSELPVVRLNPPAKNFMFWDQPKQESFIDEWLEQEIAPLLAKLNKTHKHGLGEDFAREGDLTVIAPVAVTHNLFRRIPFIVELRDIPFEMQKRILHYILDRLPNFMGAKLDATGNGSWLGEVTVQKYGAELIEAIKFSRNTYLEHMPKLKSAIEDRNCDFAADTFIVDDLRAIRLLKGVPQIPDGSSGDDRDGGKRHADFAVALMLAIAASYGEPLAYHGYQPVQTKTAFDIRGDQISDGFRMRADEVPSGASRRFGRGTF